MLKVIALKCSSCGLNVKITSEMSTFACGHCGASQIVERSGGTISLRLIIGLIVGISDTGAVIYFSNKQNSLIKLNFSEEAQHFFEHSNRIRNKIAENRRFVDS